MDRTWTGSDIYIRGVDERPETTSHHTSSSSLNLLPASLFFHSSFTVLHTKLPYAICSRKQHALLIYSLLLGAVSCTLAARTPATPTNGAVRDANKGIASPSPVPVANGKGVASTPASSKSPSPTGDPKKDNKDVTDTEKLEPFDGKPSIPYKPKPFQCEC